jgi:hypothetical protein
LNIAKALKLRRVYINIEHQGARQGTAGMRVFDERDMLCFLRSDVENTGGQSAWAFKGRLIGFLMLF